MIPSATASRVTAHTPARNRARNSSGYSSANTRANVSCDGITRGRHRNVRSEGSFARANVSTATQWCAPQITAHSAIVTMSTSRCSFVRSTRG